MSASNQIKKFETFPVLKHITDPMMAPVMFCDCPDTGKCIVVSVKGKVDVRTHFEKNRTALGYTGKFIFLAYPSLFGNHPVVSECLFDSVYDITDLYHCQQECHIGHREDRCSSCPYIGEGYWRLSWVIDLIEGKDPLWDLVVVNERPKFATTRTIVPNIWLLESGKMAYDWSRIYANQTMLVMANVDGVQVHIRDPETDRRTEHNYTITEYTELFNENESYPKLPKIVSAWEMDSEEESGINVEKKVFIASALRDCEDEKNECTVKKFSYKNTYPVYVWENMKDRLTKEVTFKISKRTKTFKFEIPVYVEEALKKVEEFLSDKINKRYYENHGGERCGKFEDMVIRGDMLGDERDIQDVRFTYA